MRRAEANADMSAAITVATAKDLQRLYAEFWPAGVALHQPLKREPFGAIFGAPRPSLSKNPDGNLLLFAGPADK